MIWLPSKPISTWIRSSGRSDHLRENAVHGVRMDEGDLETEHSLPWLRVDQLRAAGREIGERGTDVRNLVRDVVHSGPAVREELADRRLGAERREQLHAAAPPGDGRRLDALLGDGRAVLDLRAEEPFVGRHRLVEILDRDAEMVDSACVHSCLDAIPAPFADVLSNSWREPRRLYGVTGGLRLRTKEDPHGCWLH